MNLWMKHIKSTQAANPTMMFKDILKKAGKSYKKGTVLVTSIKKSMKKSRKVKKTKQTRGVKSKKSKSKKSKSKKSKTLRGKK
jgi:hypothetical protein